MDKCCKDHSYRISSSISAVAIWGLSLRAEAYGLASRCRKMSSAWGAGMCSRGSERICSVIAGGGSWVGHWLWKWWE